METKVNTQLIKRAYVKLLETYVRYGYDIADMLHPTYKNISAQMCLDVANSIVEDHEGLEWWDYEEKLTLSNI